MSVAVSNNVFDNTPPDRLRVTLPGTVSNLNRASVKVYRSVVAVSVDKKLSASSARNRMPNWTCVAKSQIRGSGVGGTSIDVYPKILCCRRNQDNSAERS